MRNALILTSIMGLALGFAHQADAQDTGAQDSIFEAFGEDWLPVPICDVMPEICSPSGLNLEFKPANALAQLKTSPSLTEFKAEETVWEPIDMDVEGAELEWLVIDPQDAYFKQGFLIVTDTMVVDPASAVTANVISGLNDDIVPVCDILPICSVAPQEMAAFQLNPADFAKTSVVNNQADAGTNPSIVAISISDAFVTEGLLTARTGTQIWIRVD